MPRRTPDRARVKILTVDPSSRRIDGGLRDGGVIQISVIETGPLFRWPQQEEIWTVYRRNNAWFLDSLIEVGENSVEDLAPGQSRIPSSVIKTSDGKTLANIETDIAGRQPLSTALTALGGTTPAADKLPYYNSGTTAQTTTLSSFMRTVLDDADAPTARATLGATKLTIHTTTATTSGPTTTSNADPFTATIPEMSVTADFSTHMLLIFFSITVINSGTNINRVAFYDNSTEIGNSRRQVNTAVNAEISTMAVYTPVSSGSRTISAKWNNNGGTTTGQGLQRELFIVELG